MADTSVSLLQLLRQSPSSSAWSRLTGIYSPLLKAGLTRQGVQDADADDLIQEIFLTVSRELPKFDHSGRPGAFRRWLRLVLVHRLRNYRRSAKYRPTTPGGSDWGAELNELEDESSDRSREWNLEHDRHVMARLLEQIRPRFAPKTWRAFHRQVIDGQRADFVAEELAMPLSSVYVARSRVLTALRREAEGFIDA